MSPAEVINKIAASAISIGHYANVGAMETAGSIISYLAKHPEAIDDFLAGRTSPVDWPIGWHTHGCLTWQGMDGKVYSPNFVRRHKLIKEMEKFTPTGGGDA